MKNIILKKPTSPDEIVTGTFSIDGFDIAYEISPNMNKNYAYNVKFYSLKDGKKDLSEAAVKQTILYDEINFKDEYDVYDWDNFLDREPITKQGTDFTISFSN
ncbi:hypothetical protein ACQW5G_00855 [Fructilactobacillus sp. Tb1]|uniref:hypothetical protein n=1 Tax=Fructilactobacillus sp. Tb1 TaxID=3422304 RepID=UPI003D2B96D7